MESGDLAAEKRAIEEREIQHRVSGLENLRVGASKSLETRTREPEPLFKRGVNESGISPFPSGLYSFVNQWQDEINGIHTFVYAGSFAKNTEDAVVVIQAAIQDPNGLFRWAEPFQIVPLGASGPIRITSADATMIFLRDSQNREFMLDAVTRRLSSA